MVCARPRTGWLCSAWSKLPRTSYLSIKLQWYQWGEVPAQSPKDTKRQYPPSHSLFTLLLSGKRYRSIRCCTTRKQSSFFLQAVRLLRSISSFTLHHKLMTFLLCWFCTLPYHSLLRYPDSHCNKVFLFTLQFKTPILILVILYIFFVCLYFIAYFTVYILI